MSEILGRANQSGLKWLVIIGAAVFIAIVCYFVVIQRFTPSWLVGEELVSADQYVEISPADLGIYPNLAKFIKNMSRNSEDPKQGVQVLIRGSHGEGRRLKRFLESRPPIKNSKFPYAIKYGGKYYGIDIIFQFKSPWVLN